MFNLFKRNKKSSFLFNEKENTACFTCNHILDELKPVLYVTHDEDGYWQFLCGLEEHKTENGRIISLKEITGVDVTVNNLFEMPEGVGAERKSVHDEWQPFKLTNT